MRNLGFQGDYERGWLDNIPVEGQDPVEQVFNLQTIRDIISQSIVDSLTDTTSTGSTSEGNTQGSQIVIKDANAINITLDPLLTTSAKAARVGDTIKIDINDPSNVTLDAWGTAVASALDTLTLSGAYTVLWNALKASGINGTITSGSETVKIGD